MKRQEAIAMEPRQLADGHDAGHIAGVFGDSTD